MRTGRGNVRIADLPANRVRSADLEAFLKKLEEDGLDPQTRLHAETSVRHAWYWATKHPSPTPYLPRTSGFGDMLRCYYHTGARTGELAACRAGDFIPGHPPSGTRPPQAVPDPTGEAGPVNHPERRGPSERGWRY